MRVRTAATGPDFVPCRVYIYVPFGESHFWPESGRRAFVREAPGSAAGLGEVTFAVGGAALELAETTGVASSQHRGPSAPRPSASL